MSCRNLPTYLGFAAWVSVCAAAPEFIWQGLLALLDHFSRANLYSIGLIGIILTVFVEPVLERVRDGRWRPEHRSRRSLLWTAPIAFTFGLVAVGLHECMTAYLAAGRTAPEENALRGFRLILEWASVPFAITLAWFAARGGRRIRVLTGGAAGAWVVAAGWLYGWPMRDVVMTSAAGLGLIVLGQAHVARNWSETTFFSLARGFAAFIVGWLVVTLLLQALLRLAGYGGIVLYGPGDLGDDIRFYLGWAIGLAIAPNPVSAAAHPPTRAPSRQR